VKTIGRNRKRFIEQLFKRATHCTVHRLDSYFRGEEVSPHYARKEFETFDFAKLKESGPGTFLLKVHSNLWFEIKSPVNLLGIDL
jgi:hypothetical protein